MIAWRDFLPGDWRDLLARTGAVGIGVDPATTAKKTSNPTGIALVQRCGLDFAARLVLRFKTADPAVTEAILRELCSLPHGLRVRKICIDATSERFFVANLKRAMAGLTTVEAVIQSEATEFRGQKMTLKAFLGNQFVNEVEDGHVLLPNEKWLERDCRQVKRENGSFAADVDADGNHADAFDALKLGVHAAMRSGGAATAEARAVGGDLAGQARHRWWKNPLARGTGQKHSNYT